MLKLGEKISSERSWKIWRQGGDVYHENILYACIKYINLCILKKFLVKNKTIYVLIVGNNTIVFKIVLFFCV